MAVKLCDGRGELPKGLLLKRKSFGWAVRNLHGGSSGCLREESEINFEGELVQ